MRRINDVVFIMGDVWSTRRFRGEMSCAGSQRRWNESGSYTWNRRRDDRRTLGRPPARRTLKRCRCPQHAHGDDWIDAAANELSQQRLAMATLAAMMTVK